MKLEGRGNMSVLKRFGSPDRQVFSD